MYLSLMIHKYYFFSNNIKQVQITHFGLVLFLLNITYRTDGPYKHLNFVTFQEMFLMFKTTLLIEKAKFLYE